MGAFELTLIGMQTPFTGRIVDPDGALRLATALNYIHPELVLIDSTTKKLEWRAPLQSDEVDKIRADIEEAGHTLTPSEEIGLTEMISCVGAGIIYPFAVPEGYGKGLRRFESRGIGDESSFEDPNAVLYEVLHNLLFSGKENRLEMLTYPESLINILRSQSTSAYAMAEEMWKLNAGIGGAQVSYLPEEKARYDGLVQIITDELEDMGVGKRKMVVLLDCKDVYPVGGYFEGSNTQIHMLDFYLAEPL